MSKISCLLKKYQSNYSIIVILCFLLFSCGVKNKSNLDENQDLVLWHDKPSDDWYSALPIGNGRQGGMVYGGIQKEHIQLNENTLYSGEPGQRYAKLDFTKKLDEVKKLVAKGKLKEVDKLISGEWLARAQECYQPFGDLEILFDHSDIATKYHKSLNLATAIQKTEYTINGTRYQREIFASHPDQVIVVNLKSDKENSISCKVSLSGAHPTAATKTKNDQLIMKGQAPALALRREEKLIREWNQEWLYPELFDEKGELIEGREWVMYGDALDGKGTFYEGRVGVELLGGELKIDGDSLHIIGATEVKLILATETSYNGFDKSPSKEGKDYSLLAEQNLTNALTKSYKELKNNHITDYQELFKRVSISIGERGEQSKLPIDERIALFQNEKDPSFSSLLMQYGRYLMISCSREGGVPINLQGIWNKDIIPMWAGSFTLNINLQMYYWMAEPSNLAECTEPLHHFIKNLSVNGEEHAKNAFSSPGWAAHHNTEIWAGAQPVDHPDCSFWPMAAPWLTQHLWTHYQYTKDINFLKDNYPIMEGAAEFLSHWLILTKEGYYTTPVGSSPENKLYVPQTDEITPYCQGPTSDIMLIRELFTNCIAASKVLGIKKDFISRISNQLDSLQVYKVGSKGQLLEWDKEYKEVYPNHRHISHIYAFCPGNEIHQYNNPKLVSAVKKSLDMRGDGGPGWSIPWKSLCRARLKDGDRAYKILSNVIVPGSEDKPGMLNNLLASCPPFNIDGNFGASAAVIEMLMQSHESKQVDGELLSVVEVLPALPTLWTKGDVTGLRTRNGFELDISWENGKLKKAKITSLLGEKSLFKYGEKEIVLSLNKGESYVID